MMTRSQSGKRPRLETNLDLVAERLRGLAAARAGKPVVHTPLPTTHKQAAVLVPLFARGSSTKDHEKDNDTGEVRVLLTKRSAALKSHQGEVCLPGGKRDPEDVDDVATALREANEELGLPTTSVQVLGSLPPLLSKHFLSVTPVVALVPPTREEHAPTPNADEVAEVFDVPLSLFLGTTGHSSRDISWQGHTYRLHSFTYENQVIWGLTAAILIQVAKHAHDCEPDFQEHASSGVEYSRFWHDGQRLRISTLPDTYVSADDVSTAPQLAASVSTAASNQDVQHHATSVSRGTEGTGQHQDVTHGAPPIRAADASPPADKHTQDHAHEHEQGVAHVDEEGLQVLMPSGT